MIEVASGLTFIQYEVQAHDTEFHVPFEFLAKDHVKAFVGTRRVASDWKDDLTLEIPSQEGLISLPYIVTLRRFTPGHDLIVKHQDGAKLPARDLRMAFQQLLFILQEITEFGTDGMGVLPGGNPGGGPGNMDDINTIIDELLKSPALKELLTEIDLIGINAETIIEEIIRSYEFHDITRDHKDKISKAHQEITLLVEKHMVTAQSILELFAALDTMNGEMQAQFEQVFTAIADEEGARVSAITDLHAQVFVGDTSLSAALNQRISNAEVTIEEARADTEERLQAQITNKTAALNTRIDSVETNAESALATTKQLLITQFTNADATLNTALNERIDEVETNADEAIAESKSLMLTQLNDAVSVINTNLSTKTTHAQAQSIASTQVEAFKNGQFAALQQSFNVVAGEHSGMYGQWQATYSVKINAGTIGGKPIIAGIALSANPATGSDFIVMADRFAIVSPYYVAGNNTTQLKFPFVVGTVGGVSTVGITGQLLVDGSITANKITTGTLAAITANAGTINGGTFKTHTLDSQGEVINPHEFRAEMTNIGEWPFWIGSGAKTANNAVMWIDRYGNAMFKGKINASNIVGSFQQGTIINWTGYLLLYNYWTDTNFGLQTATEFTLPAPVPVGETHTPFMTLTVGMNELTRGVTVVVDVLVGGSWQTLTSRTPPHTLVDRGSNRYPPLYEKFVSVSLVGLETGSAQTFRVRVSCAGETKNPVTHQGGSPYVYSVKGYVYGIR